VNNLALKDGDFVNVDYVGRVDGKIFDVTDEKLAKREKVYSEKSNYGPVTIVVGAGHLLKGIDEVLLDKKEGDTFQVSLEPEKAFGKKNSKLLKIIPERIFKDQKVKPHPGMTVNVDNAMGYVISVGSGRVIVDFNHPLAGKTLDYELTIHKKIDDNKEKIKALLQLYTGKVEYDVEVKNNEVKIKYSGERSLVPEVKNIIVEDIKKYIKLEKVEFVEEFGEKKKES
jgi:FKBP-type peptidyl-prolyl cis-trans isomerase SlyD